MAEFREHDRDLIHSLMDLAAALEEEGSWKIGAWNLAVEAEDGESYRELRARLKDPLAYWNKQFEDAAPYRRERWGIK